MLRPLGPFSLPTRQRLTAKRQIAESLWRLACSPGWSGSAGNCASSTRTCCSPRVGRAEPTGGRLRVIQDRKSMLSANSPLGIHAGGSIVQPAAISPWPIQTCRRDRTSPSGFVEAGKGLARDAKRPPCHAEVLGDTRVPPPCVGGCFAGIRGGLKQSRTYEN
jgi:hypothetical protein